MMFEAQAKKPIDRRGVAMLIVLMLILGLLILGQAAMLMLDNVALRSGGYRRQELGAYCAEEGLNLGRAWVLQAMKGANQLNPKILNTPTPASVPPGLLVDPTDSSITTGMGSPTKDLCQIAFLPTAPTQRGLFGLCRQDPVTGANLYRVNLIDDIDEPPPRADPFNDKNSVFMVRAECLAPGAELQPSGNFPTEEVAFVEINQTGSSGCYGGGTLAGCGP